jgi:hypothetical protein
MPFWGTAKAKWDAIPDKSLVFRIPAKLVIVASVVVLLLVLATVAARRVEAVAGYEPVTLADFSKLEEKVSACVPAPKKSKKR